MDQQQLGERFTRLEVGQDGLDKRLDEFQRTSTAEHDEVKKLLTEVRDAGTKQFAAQDKRIGSLEGERRERKGKQIVMAILLTVFVGPAIVGLFLIAAGVIA